MRIKYDARISYCYNENKNDLMHIYNSIKDNKLDGEYKKWYENRKLLTHCFYKDDEYDGEYIRYTLNYRIHYVVEHVIYKDGLIIQNIKLPLLSIIIHILETIGIYLTLLLYNRRIRYIYERARCIIRCII